MPSGSVALSLANRCARSARLRFSSSVRWICIVVPWIGLWKGGRRGVASESREDVVDCAGVEEVVVEVWVGCWLESAFGSGFGFGYVCASRSLVDW